MTDRIVRTKECCAMVQYTNTHLRRLEELGKFPARFKLAEGTGLSGATGWKLSEIQAWIEKRAATARRPKAA